MKGTYLQLCQMFLSFYSITYDSLRWQNIADNMHRNLKGVGGVYLACVQAFRMSGFTHYIYLLPPDRIMQIIKSFVCLHCWVMENESSRFSFSLTEHFTDKENAFGNDDVHLELYLCWVLQTCDQVFLLLVNTFY